MDPTAFGILPKYMENTSLNQLLFRLLATLPDLFRLLANCFMLFCSDLAVYMGDIQDPIKSRHRVPTPWLELHIARASSILLS